LLWFSYLKHKYALTEIDYSRLQNIETTVLTMLLAPMFTCEGAILLKQVPVHQAIGMTLCHDITRVIPGIYKGVGFKKGHIIQSDDIPLLLDMGKEHIYVWDNQNMVHEDEAAQRIAQSAAGEGLVSIPVGEGKVNLVSVYPGLLKIDTSALHEINSIDQILIATLHNNQWTPQNKIVAGTRVIPLLVEKEKVKKAEEICQLSYPLLTIKPLKVMNIGMVTTGSEIYYGRIPDAFGPVVTRKIDCMGSRISRQIIVTDDKEMIAQAIHTLLNEGVEMIVVTGGMSVDPDDRTPGGIEAAGGQIAAYGAPVLPGSMFMIAYLGKIPVLGLPACVLHASVTVFDLLLPRLLAGETLERRDLIDLGHGGLCSICPDCHFPDCGFGK